jgi:hypothetical protein
MLKDLARSGLTPEDIQAYPIALQGLGTTPAYVIPYQDQRMYRIRYDRQVDKYGQPKGVRNVWYSPNQDKSTFRDKDILYIIEGEKKAAAFVKRWPEIAAFGTGGAHNAAFTGSDGVRRLLPEIINALKPGMRVVAIYDGDILTKPGIQQAAHNLSNLLKVFDCELHICRPPLGKGVDDWLVEDPAAELHHLVPVQLSNLEISHKQLYQTLGLALSDKGLPIHNEMNCAKLLQNHFEQHGVLEDKRLGLIPGSLCEDENISIDTVAIEYVQGELLPHMPVGKITKGVDMALERRRTDVVQEMFKQLVWDGVPRLDTWGSDYFETDFPAYANEWGRLLITSLTLRVLYPGTKVDCAFILAAAQGIGKTTFFEELSTFDGHKFYHDINNFAKGEGDANRTEVIKFAASVIVDLAEGAIFEHMQTAKTRSDNAKQKLTAQEDIYRPVYAKRARTEKRGFIFVGTTNRLDQSSDITGSRRWMFLNIQGGSLIRRLDYQVKLQLIAEVVAKAEALRASDWYSIRLRYEDIPEHLRNAAPGTTNVQEIYNAQNKIDNVRIEIIKQLLDEGQAVRVKKSRTMFITPRYITSMVSVRDPRATENSVSRTLSALVTANTFPYKVRKFWPRIQQLEAPPELAQLYFGMQLHQLDPGWQSTGYVAYPREGYSPTGGSDAIEPVEIARSEQAVGEEPQPELPQGNAERT